MSSVPYRALTGEQLEELREAFEIFDKNGDGHITITELTALLTALNERPSTPEVELMLDQADFNEDGVLDFPEFIGLMSARLTVSRDDDELRAAFRQFDTNGSGTIERAEVKAVLAGLGERLKDSEIELIMREVDMDRDGKVSFEEFKQVRILCPFHLRRYSRCEKMMHGTPRDI